MFGLKKNKLSDSNFELQYYKSDNAWYIMFYTRFFASNEHHIDYINCNDLHITIKMFRTLMTTAKQDKISDTLSIDIRRNFSFKMINNVPHLYLKYATFKGNEIEKFFSKCEKIMKKCEEKDNEFTRIEEITTSLKDKCNCNECIECRVQDINDN